MKSNRKQEILLYIETDDFSLYMKGLPYNERYQSLHQYKKHLQFENETMDLRIEGPVNIVEVFDAHLGILRPFTNNDFPPIFFENGVYLVVIDTKTNDHYEFYHENIDLRNSVTPVRKESPQLLMGQLHYMNEIGYSTFSIQKNHETVLTVTIEIFPSKLSYKEDYQQLLAEVNDEIYNLAFHFIKKTYQLGTVTSSGKPTYVEFYRLVEHFFPSFINAIKQIENHPHHSLTKQYELVRGDQMRKIDSKARKHLVSHRDWFVEVENGIIVNGRSVLPEKGYNVKKIITYDNLENRFVKWMMIRLIDKLEDLKKQINNYQKHNDEEDTHVTQKIQTGINYLTAILRKTFWQKIGKLDRTVLNLVMQMKVGYRDAYKIYLILMKGITLQGELLKMSLKDVATLYEYWTYLKMGQILRKYYILENQNVVQHKYGSLFIHLVESASSRQIFIHPQTGERIILSYQKKIRNLPTVDQKPDIYLEIQKKDVTFTYNFVFDAKYRIQFSNDTPTAGPVLEDINTMHRYRDALVVQSGGPYEREAFGAYVLFPWDDEENYENHPLYQSIEEVNVGALPFLPNATHLVERLVERLVNSSSEELQEEGILPRGSVTYFNSKLDEKVLVVSMNDPDKYLKAKQKRKVEMRLNSLKKDWEKAKYLAIYITKDLSLQLQVEHGVKFYGEIDGFTILEEDESARIQFHIKAWQILTETIKPVGYGIQNNIVTTINLLKQAKDLPELFMKFGEERKLWRMLRRLTSKVKTVLDSNLLDRATKIQAYQIGFFSVDYDTKSKEIQVYHHHDLIKSIPINKLNTEPTAVFRILREIIFQ